MPKEDKRPLIRKFFVITQIHGNEIELVALLFHLITLHKPQSTDHTRCME